VGWEGSVTNIDEFLSVCEGELVANGGHDRLLACIEIYVAMWKIKVISATMRFSPRQGKVKITFGRRGVGRN
jgi:hypothetical protein